MWVIVLFLYNTTLEIPKVFLWPGLIQGRGLGAGWDIMIWLALARMEYTTRSG